MKYVGWIVIVPTEYMGIVNKKIHELDGLVTNLHLDGDIFTMGSSMPQHQEAFFEGWFAVATKNTGRLTDRHEF